ncbi:MAG: phosphoribosylformylglycinamidine synthase, partial [Ectothiorhodospiraceae bacterium]
MLRLIGNPALSLFRSQRLLTELRAVAPAVTAVSSRFVHFVDLNAGLDDEEMQVLERLLTYGDPDGPGETEGALLLVVPRIGTISPWSSKATDIAHNCGLTTVRRIERGVAHFLRGPGGAALDAASCDAAAALLHDRMTETVLGDWDDAPALFRQSEPAPLGTVDALGGGRDALLEADRMLGL